MSLPLPRLRAAGWRVGNAPCSWGIIENIKGAHPSYALVLDEMQDAGYVGTELGEWGFMPTDPARLRDEVASRNLKLLASWVTVRLHDPAGHQASIDAAVKTAKLLSEAGADAALIVLGNDPYVDPVRSGHAGRITADMGMNDEQWRAFAKGATDVATQVREETGLRTVFHHHIGTWIETPDETSRLMNSTDPELLGLCFDTGHWTFGGGDAVEGIRRYRGRIWHVHFKDHDRYVADESRRRAWDGPTAIGHGVFCELGKGDVNFAAVARALDEIGYGGWIVVEQDVLPGMGRPIESATRNRQYLRSIGL